ncbi:MAG TPA: alpha/beta hydrolase [Nocardioidaceae bacterium]|nr:alpha/beta hydrolase [Nocardioidaceae bacterium]
MTRTLTDRAEELALHAAMALPAPVLRRAAGRPVGRDGQVLDAQTQWMLRLRRWAGYPGPETLPVAEGRRAVDRQARLVGGHQPVGSVCELSVPGAAGPLPARLYTPRSAVPAAAGSPLLVFFHGGGMVFGSLDSHDASCRMVAERAHVPVLSVAYRLAPEHPYPAGLDDAWAVYQWVAEHSEDLADASGVAFGSPAVGGIDPRRIAVGGDSAGAYLAAAVALKAAEAGVPCAFQMLVYPVTNMADPTSSREMFGKGYYLTDRFIELSRSAYVGQADPRDPGVSLAFTEKIPSALAPALVATAGFDPLRDEGEAYARRLADVGVEVHLIRYPGLIHSFFNQVGVVHAARAAVAEIAVRLGAGLGAVP